MVEKQTLCSQTPLCFVFKGLDGVAGLLPGKVKRWLCCDALRWPAIRGNNWLLPWCCLTANLLMLWLPFLQSSFSRSFKMVLLQPWGVVVLPPSSWVDWAALVATTAFSYPVGTKMLSRRGVAGEKCPILGAGVLPAGMAGLDLLRVAVCSCDRSLDGSSFFMSKSSPWRPVLRVTLTRGKQVPWDLWCALQTTNWPSEGNNC